MRYPSRANSSLVAFKVKRAAIPPAYRANCPYPPEELAERDLDRLLAACPAAITASLGIMNTGASGDSQVGMNRYGVLATAVLAIHLAWITWVISGWLVSRNRPWPRWFHFASLIYGVFIEILPLPCPLTLLENYLESLAGVTPYRGPFLVHYLDAVVYPNVPEALLVSVAVAVCGVNLFLHVRWLRRHSA